MRNTKVRSIVASVIDHAHSPLDSAQILSLVWAKDANINRATIFRTLNTLVAEQVLNRLELGEGKYLYESSHTPHHHHLVCVRCNRIEELFMCGVSPSLIRKAKSHGFTVEKHSLELFGICKNCNSAA